MTVGTYELPHPWSPPGPCTDCGGNRVPMWCPPGEMGLMRGRPGAGTYRTVSSLVAVVCTGCGRATLYAKDPAAVRAAAQQSPQDFDWSDTGQPRSRPRTGK